jgi:CHAT domain-containing protein
VTEALPTETALLEFFRYSPFHFAALTARGQTEIGPERYLACVVTGSPHATIALIDLGDAETLDDEITDFLSGIGSGDRHLTTCEPSPSEGRDVGVRLRQRLLDPLWPALSDFNRLIVAPDGEIHRLPIGVLPLDRERRVLDEYQISYVTAGRDLLRKPHPGQVCPSPPLIIADPAFELPIPQRTSLDREGLPIALRSVNAMRRKLDRLAGSRAEGEQVARLLQVSAFFDETALKSRLLECRSPVVIHIATHGFFVEAPDDEHPEAVTPEPSAISEPWCHQENPLLRSGLAFAGAANCMRGEVATPNAGSGFVTAEEIAGLDLRGTELVVLSACETGRGEIRAGEGVFGLQRSFMLAGAQTLVMSLWKVPDQPTRKLMVSFYERLLRGESRMEALRGAQLSVKAEHPEPLCWAGFVLLGADRSLSLGR